MIRVEQRIRSLDRWQQHRPSAPPASIFRLLLALERPIREGDRGIDRKSGSI
jgi:hypothetical protein